MTYHNQLHLIRHVRLRTSTTTPRKRENPTLAHAKPSAFSIEPNQPSSEFRTQLKFSYSSLARNEIKNHLRLIHLTRNDSLQRLMRRILLNKENPSIIILERNHADEIIPYHHDQQINVFPTCVKILGRITYLHPE